MISKKLLSTTTLFLKLFVFSSVISFSSGFKESVAQTKYESWKNPNAPVSTPTTNSSGELEKLLSELNKLIGDAERDRAAAPAFLRDLRSLAGRYDVPWPSVLVLDTFSDGNITANPTWQVSNGKWWVEKGFGLRAAFEETTPSSSGKSTNQQNNQDIGKQLFGAILNQALGGLPQNESNSNSSNGNTSAEPLAAIHLNQQISNAFSAQIDFTSWRREGSFELATTQGSERKSGYRLHYRPGQVNSFELSRRSNRGSNVLQVYRQNLILEDKRTHILRWTRDNSGTIKVTIDGREILSTIDRGFNDPFDGFSLINNNGDFIISKVEIKGTK